MTCVRCQHDREEHCGCGHLCFWSSGDGNPIVLCQDDRCQVRGHPFACAEVGTAPTKACSCAGFEAIN